MSMQLPKQGIGRDALFEDMRKRKEQDADWHGGRTFSLIYPVSDEVDGILAEANKLYMFENALNPFRFPSLRQMEVDVVSMTAGLLNAPEDADGCMTSGGTESILMAVMAARNRAREERGVTEPEMLAPVTAHPAFAKAAKYLGSPPPPDSHRSGFAGGPEGGREHDRRADRAGGGVRPELPLRDRRPDPRAGRPRRRAGNLLPHRFVSGQLPPALPGAARPSGSALRFPRPRCDHHVRRRPQVRLLHQGRLRRAPPGWIPSQAVPALRLLGLARRYLRLLLHGGSAARGTDRRGLGDHALPGRGRVPAAGRRSPRHHHEDPHRRSTRPRDSA